MTATPTDIETLSAECVLAARPDYAGLHVDCRQTKDVPLPGARGIMLVRRCTCSCHTYNRHARPAGSLP
jgi:hypothetical protein